MVEELGKIEKPPADKFSGSRKLFYIPLIFTAPQMEADFQEKVNRYWSEVEAQVNNLEMKLGSVSVVYHEMIPVGGEEGCSAIGELSGDSYRIVKARLDRGAKLEPIEDAGLLTEFMDWSRCLSIGLQNQNVINKVYDAYVEVQRRRNENMARRIDETLKADGAGILLMREGHQVQFPPGVEVFYIAPPALEDIKRWVRDVERSLQAAERAKMEEKPAAEEKAGAVETAEKTGEEKPKPKKKRKTTKKPEDAVE